MVDPHDGAQPFRDEEEKLRFLLESHYIQLATPLPCNTDECLQMASVASADFDMAEKVWAVVPLSDTPRHKWTRILPSPMRLA